MAIADAAKMQAFFSEFAFIVSRQNVFAGIANRKYEREMQNKRQGNIPVFGTAVAITKNAAGNDFSWPTAGRADVTNKTITWQDIWKFSEQINPDESGMLSAPLLLATAQAAGRAQAKEIDDEFVTDLNALTLTGQTQNVGDSSNYVPKATGIGAAASGESKNLVLDEINELRLLFEQNNLSPLTGVGTAGLQWYLPMPPHLARNVELALEAKGVDVITSRILFGRPIMTIYGNMHIIRTNALDDVTISSNDYYPFYAIASPGLTFGMRFVDVVTFPPRVNQSSYAWLINGIAQTYIEAEDTTFIYRRNIRAEA